MNETSLDYDSVIDEACNRAGLDDFGGRGLEKEPLRRLLAALDGEGGLSEAGRAIQRERIVNILVTNLQFERFWRHHPEIAREEIAAPVVIIGLGRTGTTKLHRLLAADERSRSARWWEARFPVPMPGETVDDPRERIAMAKAEVEAMYETVPNLAAIHPLDAMQADEEILLLEQSFYSSTPESAAYLPDYAQWLDAQDQTPGYLHLKRLLQFLQWQQRRRGVEGERWVLKTPHHVHYTDVLFDVFPAARVVQTHRDPLVVVPSWTSMVHALWQQNCDAADPIAAGRHWSEKVARGMERCTRVRDEVGEDRFLDVHYEDTARQPMAVVQRIYEFIGRELDARARRRMEAWLASNAREDRPPHEYTLETFGFTEQGLKEQFATYRERFISPEAQRRYRIAAG